MSKKILLACDLDNTLIHSLRRWREGDVCVEWVDGKEWGFMSRGALELLGEVSRRTTLIPVTTRSVAQYSRLKWPEGLAPRCAVTTNGALMLADGEDDASWRGESMDHVAPVRAQLEAMMADLSASGEFMRCRMVDDAYGFVYCREMQHARDTAARFTDLQGLRCTRSGKKVYFFPEGIDKGAAVLRLRKRFEADMLICAGDSSIDVPMLRRADLAIAPAGACLDLAGCGEACLCDGEDFSVDVLRRVLQAVGD